MFDVSAKILQLSVKEAMRGVSCQMPSATLKGNITGFNVHPAWIRETSSVSNDLVRNTCTICCRFSQHKEARPEFLPFRNLSSLKVARLRTAVRRW